MLYAGYDNEHREVIFKAVRTGSTELSILEDLNSPGARADRRNPTIPVIDTIPLGEWTIVVMPAWGTVISVQPNSIREYLQQAEQYLKVMVFLVQPVPFSQNPSIFLRDSHSCTIAG